ncbi:hypothetical protein GCM10009118_25800 [Wandonia haliotis]|uniref:DUF3857 domain-containing protein n=1 Tax=Wandonia haliotis TaxID=574963 RepID=A0ABP3Y3L3_9FLAO
MKKLLFIITLVVYSSFQAQNNNVFPDYQKQDIPDHLIDEPVIILENRTTLDYLTGADFRRLLFRRAIIQNKEGAEEYSKIFINEVNNENLDRIEVRTIKPDGRIINLQENDIITTRHQEGNGYYTVNGYKIVVPNLEAGDVVDLYYSFSFNRIEISQEVYFAQKYPSLISTIEIRNASRFQVNAFLENGDTPCDVSERDLMKVYRWTKTDLPGLGSDDYSSLSRKMEHLNCYLWEKGSSLTYDYFYFRFSESVAFDEFNLANMKMLLANGVLKKEDTPLNNLIRFNDFIDTAFTWESVSSSKLNNRNPNDCFSDKVIAYSLLYDYWSRYLKLLKSDYILGYTRNKFDGPIAENYFIPNHLETPFFILMEEETPYYFFLPGRDRSFKVNEIPYEFEFNNAVLFYHSYKKKDATDIKFMDIPLNDFRKNNWNSRKMITIQDDNISFRRQDNWSGVFAQEFRKPLSDGNYPFDIDEMLTEAEIQDSSFQFDITEQESKCSFSWKGTATGLQEKVSEGISQFNIGKALTGFSFEISSDERNNDIFLPFGYRVKDNIYITFDSEVQLVEADENLKKELKNDAGFFVYSIAQADPKTIVVTLQYGMFGSIFLSNQLHLITEIETQVKKLSEQSFMYQKI